MPALHERNKLKTEVVHKTVATRTFEWHEIKELLIQRMAHEMEPRGISGSAIDHGRSQQLGASKARLRNNALVEFKVDRLTEGSPSYNTEKYEITLTYTHDHAAPAEEPARRDLGQDYI